ncbi:methylglyoxal synthase [Dehalogenimonas formicexedens]|uniref:methylglyoxal synthase n=1 Tax=Dehalogenimonas formicexedens TaxID=1839801 RepID=UPI000BFFB336|nr:methylglyoxal synthase [Dehalogenimonas formicexedens]
MSPITLALIAHDNKKEEMLSLVEDHRDSLSQLSLVATRSTGMLIQSRTGLQVTLMQSGPMGGDQQIGSLVASGMVKAVIFLRDPLTVQPHEPDVSALLRLCDVHNVPLATNLTTAEAVLHLIFEHGEIIDELTVRSRFLTGVVSAL